VAVALHMAMAFGLWSGLSGQRVQVVPLLPLPTTVATIEVELREPPSPEPSLVVPGTKGASTPNTPTGRAAAAVPTLRIPDRGSGERVDVVPTIDSVMADGTPARPMIGKDIVTDVIRGLDARGPQPTRATLAAALDYQGSGEQGGRALSDAGRAQQTAGRMVAVADAAGRHGHTWLAELGRNIERRYAPTPQDLSNPNDVSREKILTNYLLDITQWDDEAKRALTSFYETDALHSQDPIKRLSAMLPRVGSVESPAEREQRLWQLISKREQGMAVRFSFPVEVHHDGVGKPTAIDVRLADHERGLDRLIRSSIDAALLESPPAPPDASDGQPFISHWVISSTWFMDPPRPMLAASDTPGAPPILKIATKFDVTQDEVTTQDFNVHHRVDVELRSIEVLTR
jgi:hypothetical protein